MTTAAYAARTIEQQTGTHAQNIPDIVQSLNNIETQLIDLINPETEDFDETPDQLAEALDEVRDHLAEAIDYIDNI